MICPRCPLATPALFTPVDPLSASDTPPNPSEAGTVLGNSRLIRDMSTMFPFSSSPELWTRRVNWATHVADVRFVEASMSANRLVDAASASASILQSATTSEKRRNEVRGVLEATIRRLVPFEKAQGSCLLGLGRVMLEAVGALYLGRGELASRRRRDQSRDSAAESDDGPIVPENELVRETRQVLIRCQSPSFHLRANGDADINALLRLQPPGSLRTPTLRSEGPHPAPTPAGRSSAFSSGCVFDFPSTF